VLFCPVPRDGERLAESKIDFLGRVNSAEILELAGCDLLTISPNFLEELKNGSTPVVRKLKPDQARQTPMKKLTLDEKSFRYLLNEDAIATEKLSEGIRKFAEDAQKLENHLISHYQL